jgi:hypothetical protein
MKIRRLIATMLVSLALLVGLLAGGLGGFTAPVAEANPCNVSDPGNDTGNVNIGNIGGNDNCDQEAPPAE